jgi:putative DNA primase/helicase
MTPFAAAAEAYAVRFGWHVFPLRGKLPMIPRSQGGQGFKDATTDSDQIRAWWRRWPNANVGVACGASGITALDIDVRSYGDVSIVDIEREHGALPDTPQNLSGRGDGGLHHVFAGVVDTHKAADGIDVKSDGGYIVVPPSIHPDTGRAYRWDCVRHPLEIPLAPMPEWIRRGTRRSKRAAVELTEKVDPDSFALGRAFKRDGLLGDQIKPGVFLATCPNAHTHTQGKAGDSSTVIFAPQPGYSRGRFFCAHSHCEALFR